MDLIKNFFERFAHLTPPDDVLKRIFCEVLEQEYQITLPRQAISVRNHIVYVAAPAALKSELFMRKNKIINLLKERLGKMAPADIR